MELKRGRRVCAGGGCVDSPSWWAAKRTRDCDYVAKKAATLCTAANVDASGVSALGACGASRGTGSGSVRNFFAGLAERGLGVCTET